VTAMWLGAATPVEGGLAIPGSPHRYTADLRLCQESAWVQAAGSALRLDWDGHSGSWHLDGWWASKKGNPTGVALAVDGDLIGQARPVRQATRSVRARFNEGWVRGWKLPLHPSDPFGKLIAERDTVDALCAVLRQRQEVRTCLADSTRVRQLLSDMQTGARHKIELPDGVRRTTIEILTAMRQLGFEHPIGGRPVPGDSVLARGEIVSQVAGYLRSSPYARDLEIDDSRVGEVIDHYLLAVKPWPFAALS